MNCAQCGSAVGNDGVCMKCLLDSGIAGSGQSLAERIFQAALSLGAGERAAFVANAASGDAAVLEEVRMLLQGYEEAGGDAAEATLGGTARERWAGVRREEPGTVIGHFRLVKVIGEGGMGSVWEAEQNAPIKRRVALKIIKLGMDTEEVVKRFERERRTLALMAHPHIAQVYEAGATPAGRPFFAMELVDGTAITLHCAQAGLTLRDRLALFLDVCAAVEHAHQKGVIHRDLKPSNILVADGAVKVIDFGIAKATQESTDGLLTQQAQVLGTPAYMSPEQAESNGTDVDTRTDVYSLGAVLYELLSGALPFDPKRLAGTHPQEVQRILREEEPPRPSTRAIPMLERKTDRSRQPAPPSAPQPPTGIHPAELRNDLDWIVMKALSKERGRRYASAASFAADVRRFLAGEAVNAVPPTLAYRAGKFVRRNKAAVAAVAGIVLALSAGLIISLRQVQRTNEALAGEARARREATFTVADLYTRSGLTAAEKGEPARAALWFTRAARIAEDDPVRASANRLRAAVWTLESHVPVAAFDTGFPYSEDIVWHPGGGTIIVERMDGGAAQVYDVVREAFSPLVPDGADSAAWDAAGSRLAVVRQGKVQVMEYPSGRLLAERGVAAGSQVALSPDGLRVALGGETPFLWDWGKDEAVFCTAVPHAKRIRWSKDGRYCLWQALTQVAAVDAADPERILFPPLSNHWKTLVSFADDGHTFFHSDRHTKQTFLRDAATGAVVREAPGGSWALAMSRDSHYVAFGDAPLWSGSTGNTRRNPVHRNGDIMEGASFSPDGTRLATAAYDAKVRLWQLSGDLPLGEVGVHQHPIQSVSWSPDASLLASGQNSLVRIWRIQTTPLLRSIPLPSPTLAALSGDGKYVAASGMTQSSSSGRTTRVFEIATGQPAGPEIALDGVLMDAVFVAAGEIALAVSTTPERQTRDWTVNGGSGHLEVRDWRSGQRTAGPFPLPSEPRGLALHPSGGHIAVSGAFGECLEWERSTAAPVPLIAGGRVSQPFGTLTNGRCAYAGGGRYLVAWGGFERLNVYDRTAGREVRLSASAPASGAVHDVGFSGNLLALAPTGPPAPLVQLLDYTTGLEVAAPLPHSDWMYLAQFDETGTLLLTTGRRPMAQIWDWRAGRQICPALPHTTDTMAGVFVPGTPWVITGSHDGLVRFWDRRSGMMIRPPVMVGGHVLQLTLTPDGHYLVAGGSLHGPALAVIDLRAALPANPVSPDPLEAELNAAAIIHEGGGIVPLTSAQWLEKWRARKKMTAPAGR